MELNCATITTINNNYVVGTENSVKCNAYILLTVEPQALTRLHSINST